ncbi:MAG: FlgD immunoglobulin-like domain containing protein [Candidatus Zixiibacteriota bacterium]
MLSMGLATAASASSVWTTPVPLDSNINQSFTDYWPCISADGRRLYFSSTRSGGYGDEDIYYSDWDSIAQSWSEAVNCSTGVNTLMREFSPAITSDGSRLYFVSSRGGGYSDWDVWYSDWDADSGRFLSAVNAGPNINTVCVEWSVAISNDMKTLYVASGYFPGHACDLETLKFSRWNEIDSAWGPSDYVPFQQIFPAQLEAASVTANGLTMAFQSWGGFSSLSPCFQGNYELYTATWNGSAWDIITALCPPVNSPTFDGSPSLSADGRCLYFASSRDDPEHGSTDIYVSYNLGDTTYVVEYPSDVLPSELTSQNYPNPFNLSTVIEFNLPLPAQVSCTIYNSQGRTVIELIDKNFSSGRHVLRWDGTDSSGQTVASGIYLYVIDYLGTRIVRKMTLIK